MIGFRASWIALILAVLIFMGGIPRLAAQNNEWTLAPDQVEWPSGESSLIGTSFVAGIETVVVHGDPTGIGLYTLLLRVPPHTRIQAHSHPDDRVATVLAGTWFFGYGDAFDEGSLKELPSGSIYSEPPGSNHFAMTREEGVVIQITGIGPTGTTYVDPRHDPSDPSRR